MFLLAFSWLFWVCFCRSFLSLVFTGYVSPFSIYAKDGLVMLNYLNFCLSVKLLNSPSYLNDILAGYSNLDCRLFSFITLSTSCHSLLDWRVSIDRSAVILMGIPLCVVCCFSLAAFNICSLCLIFVNLIKMCLGVSSPWVYPVWNSLCFLDLGGYFCRHFGEVFSYYLLEYLLISVVWYYIT